MKRDGCQLRSGGCGPCEWRLRAPRVRKIDVEDARSARRSSATECGGASIQCVKLMPHPFVASDTANQILTDSGTM